MENHPSRDRKGAASFVISNSGFGFSESRWPLAYARGSDKQDNQH